MVLRSPMTVAVAVMPAELFTMQRAGRSKHDAELSHNAIAYIQVETATGREESWRPDVQSGSASCRTRWAQPRGVNSSFASCIVTWPSCRHRSPCGTVAYTMQKVDEQQFRTAVRDLLAHDRYPDHGQLTRRLGMGYTHSGFTEQQTRWRRQEVQAAGYDYDASKRVRRLVRPGA
jgi:hypothetical protein